MRRHAGIPLRIVVDDRVVLSHTRVRWAATNLVVWETVLPELGVELHSAYTGPQGTDPRVEHLVLSPAFGDIETVEPERESPVIVSDSRRNPLDHLLRLHELLEQSGHTARIGQIGRVERLRDAWRRATGWFRSGS